MFRDGLQELRTYMRYYKRVDIARISGVHVNTIQQIYNGKNSNPGIETCQAILDAITILEKRTHSLERIIDSQEFY